jgi:hypothetical protein
MTRGKTVQCIVAMMMRMMMITIILTMTLTFFFCPLLLLILNKTKTDYCSLQTLVAMSMDLLNFWNERARLKSHFFNMTPLSSVKLTVILVTWVLQSWALIFFRRNYHGRVVSTLAGPSWALYENSCKQDEGVRHRHLLTTTRAVGNMA